MPRAVSNTFRSAVFSSETGEAFLALITIDHAVIDPPIRVTSDGVDTISRGNTYTPYPFRVQLPSDMEDRPPVARLAIDNVSREIARSLRGISSPATVTVEIVLGAAPDIVEAAFPDFTLREARGDSLTVEGDLTIEQYMSEPYPAGRFTPAEFPGLF